SASSTSPSATTAASTSFFRMRVSSSKANRSVGSAMPTSMVAPRSSSASARKRRAAASGSLSTTARLKLNNLRLTNCRLSWRASACATVSSGRKPRSTSTRPMRRPERFCSSSASRSCSCEIAFCETRMSPSRARWGRPEARTPGLIAISAAKLACFCFPYNLQCLAVALELVLRARHCLSLDRLAEAEALAREAAATPASAADALHILGVTHRRAGRLEAAEAALRQAIKRDDATAAFHNELGNALQDRGRLNEAIAAYRRALRLFPEFAEAWNDLGTARYANGELEAAVECYHRALRLQPDHLVAHANLGAVYRKLGLLSEARRVLQRELWHRLRQGLRVLWPRKSALELRSAPHLAVLGQAQLRVGNARHAAAIAQRALELDPRNVDALRVFGIALLRQDRRADALGAMHQAVELRPQDADLQLQFARALASLERFDEAMHAYEKACQLRPEAGALVELAQLKLQRGEAAAAEALLRQAQRETAHNA